MLFYGIDSLTLGRFSTFKKKLNLKLKSKNLKATNMTFLGHTVGCLAPVSLVFHMFLWVSRLIKDHPEISPMVYDHTYLIGS